MVVLKTAVGFAVSLQKQCSGKHFIQKNPQNKKTQTNPPHITKTKKKLCTSNAAFLTSFSSECKHSLKDKQMALLVIKVRLNPTGKQKRDNAHVKDDDKSTDPCQ